MQLPFTPAPRPAPPDPEALKQRRQELARRLVEMNQKKREQKVRMGKATFLTSLVVETGRYLFFPFLLQNTYLSFLIMLRRLFN